jgi:putative phosphoribosyl transferase
MQFHNREVAGSLLAQALQAFTHDRPLVLALARGGIPVGREIANALTIPLEVLVVRKLRSPAQPEMGIGAVGEAGVVVVDDDLRRRLRISDAAFDAMVLHERLEVARRVARYRGGHALPSLAGQSVILVDDGVATGSTAVAAIRAARALHADRVTFATPVCAPQAAAELRREADRVVALALPPMLLAVGDFYDDFHQLDDREVMLGDFAEDEETGVGD